MYPFGSSCNWTGVGYILMLSSGLHQHGWEGDPDDWAAQCLHTSCPDLHPGEDTLVSLQHNTGDSSYKWYLQSNFHRKQGYELPQSVGEITATACLKLRTPQPLTCWPNTICLPRWVLRTWQEFDRRSELHLCTRQNKEDTETGTGSTTTAMCQNKSRTR